MTPTLACPDRSTPPKRTALVVDDIEDMLDLLEIALNAANFSVLRASSAAQAREVFKERGHEIDLLLTDVNVGSDSGLVLADHLMDSKPSLFVLATSGFALDKSLIARRRVDFLPKPFSTSELKQKLASIFAASPARLKVTVSGESPGKYSVSAACV